MEIRKALNNETSSPSQPTPPKPAATYGPGSGITAAAGTRFAPPPPDRELTVAVCRGVRAKYRNIEAPK